MKQYIIRTSSESEVINLYTLVGKKFDNMNFWGTDKVNYHKIWYWWIENDGSLSGVSGEYGEPDSTMRRLKRPLVFFEYLKDLI